MKKYEITKEFDDIINDTVENWSLREYLEEVENYGQTEFTYYSETTEMYDKYRQDCQEWLDDLVNETGMKPWEYFNSWDYDINSKENKWNVICAMFEQYCIDRLEGFED